jgi:hypothetical protein
MLVWVSSGTLDRHWEENVHADEDASPARNPRARHLDAEVEGTVSTVKPNKITRACYISTLLANWVPCWNLRGY